jgi:uncharacterized damage-inducible protein DinB
MSTVDQVGLSAGERTRMRHYLSAQRDSVLAIVDGLDEDVMHRRVLPSGWTIAGMIEHLGDAERFWFERVVAGLPAVGDPAADEGPGFSTTRPAPVVLDRYRARCVKSDLILDRVSFDDVPAGEIPTGMAGDIQTVRDVVLHMIEETARHAGHLDVVRELVDGRTGLGPR